MLKALTAGRSWPSLPDLDFIVSQTRLIIRKSRKFTVISVSTSAPPPSSRRCFAISCSNVTAPSPRPSGVARSNAYSSKTPPPAHCNHYGKTAGVKIDFAFDLLTGSIVSHSLQAATEQDKSIGKEFVIEVRRGDLVLRDMGYFSLTEFT